MIRLAAASDGPRKKSRIWPLGNGSNDRGLLVGRTSNCVRWRGVQFLTKHENGREYFIEALGTSPFNLCYSIKAQLREIAMINFAFGVPVKTRLPLKAWTLAAIVTLFSLASSIIHYHDASDHAIYAGVAAAHGGPRGS
jgi:hypothetical protein